MTRRIPGMVSVDQVRPPARLRGSRGQFRWSEQGVPREPEIKSGHRSWRITCMKQSRTDKDKEQIFISQWLV